MACVELIVIQWNTFVFSAEKHVYVYVCHVYDFVEDY